MRMCDCASIKRQISISCIRFLHVYSSLILLVAECDHGHACSQSLFLNRWLDRLTTYVGIKVASRFPHMNDSDFGFEFSERKKVELREKQRARRSYTPSLMN